MVVAKTRVVPLARNQYVRRTRRIPGTARTVFIQLLHLSKSAYRGGLRQYSRESPHREFYSIHGNKQ